MSSGVLSFQPNMIPGGRATSPDTLTRDGASTRQVASPRVQTTPPSQFQQFQEGMGKKSPFSMDPANQPLAAPKIVASNPENKNANQETVTYKDPFGRIAVGKGNTANNTVIRGPNVVTPTSLTRIGEPTTPGATTPNVTTPTTPIETVPPEIDFTDLSTIGKLVLGGSLAYQGYQAFTDTAINTGLFSGFANWVDDTVASMIPGAWGNAWNTPGIVGGSEGLAIYGKDIVNPGVTSPTNAMGAGSFGGALAGLLGLSYGNFFVDAGTGIAGGLAGAAVGNAIGGTMLGIAAGTLGAFIGGFAVTALVGLFAPKPSDKTAAGTYNVSYGQVTASSSLEGKKYSEQNNSFRDEFFKYTSDLQKGIEDFIGGKAVFGTDDKDVYNNVIHMQAGRVEGLRLDLGNTGQYVKFENAKDAMEYIGKTMVQKAVGIKDPNVELARRNINYQTQSFDSVMADIKFAKDFDSYSKALANGTIAVDMPKNDAMIVLNTWRDTAIRLGFDNNVINTSYNKGIAKINSVSG